MTEQKHSNAKANFCGRKHKNLHIFKQECLPGISKSLWRYLGCQSLAKAASIPSQPLIPTPVYTPASQERQLTSIEQLKTRCQGIKLLHTQFKTIDIITVNGKHYLRFQEIWKKCQKCSSKFISTLGSVTQFVQSLSSHKGWLRSNLCKIIYCCDYFLSEPVSLPFLTHPV